MKTELGKRLGVFLAVNIILALLIAIPCSWAQEYKPGEILVKFKALQEEDALQALRTKLNATKIKKFKINNVYHLKLPAGSSVENAVSSAYTDPNVEYAEPNYKLDINATPNDPEFYKLYGMHNTGQTGGTADADIDAPEAWDIITTTPVIIAVIDTGVDYNHQDLTANMWHNPGEIPNNGVDDDGNGYVDDYYGYDFAYNDSDPYDGHSHGTHCSGTIAAVGNNSIGVVGVCWNAKIMAVKFLNDGGSGYTSDAVEAVQYAVANGAKVLSNSWGGGGFSQALKDAIIAAHNAGALFIAAAGNSGSNNDTSPHYPSSYDVDNVIAVAATDHSDNLASFSCYGPTSVDLAAPGVNIWSTVPGNSYSGYSGTSMATPHVAGICALVMGKYPGLTNLQIKARLLSTVDQKSSLTGKMVSNGRANVYKALTEGSDTTPPAAITDLAISLEPTYKSVILAWTAVGDDNLTGTATSYDLRYSTSLIDENNFNSASSATGLPAPQQSGSQELFTVDNLNPNTTYYFAIKALDEWGNASDISNVVSAKTGIATLIFQDKMENGMNGWTISGTDGSGGSSLWHLSNKRFSSSTTSWYYADEKKGNYNTGTRNYGSITSPSITMPPNVTDVALTFKYWRSVESYPSAYDVLDILCSHDNGISWTIYKSISSTTPSQKTWLSSGYIKLNVGQQEQTKIRFNFDTKDSIANSYEGIYIDDIEIVGVEPPDNTPPADITDLAILKTGTTHVMLSWTATGDDGATGKAFSYDIRYSTKNINTEKKWNDATQVTGEPSPKTPGSQELFYILDLDLETKYYFVMKVMDNAGNESGMSNVVSTTTTAPPEASVNPTEMPLVTLTPDSTTTQTLTITNNGFAPLNFSITDTKVTGLNSTIVKAVEPPLSGAAEQSSAPNTEYIEGEILVKFREGLSESSISGINSEIGTSTIKTLNQIGVHHLKITSGLSVEEVIEHYSNNPDVEYAEPNGIVEILSTPNDPKFTQLYGLNNTGQTGGCPDKDIDAPEAWDYFTGGEQIVIAVIDTGVDYNHEDLAANIWTNPGEICGNGVDDDGNGYVDDCYGWDFCNDDNNPMDDHYHGTHCSGTIGGVGNNGIGVTGVNWNVKIMAIKFLSSGGGGSWADAIASVLYSVDNGARISSNSWGGGGFSQGLKDAIEYGNINGCLFVAAAGNNAANSDVSPLYPAAFNCTNIISVAATDHCDNLASFSNYGPTTVDLGAPGVSILSTTLNNTYGSASGTSMATPHVAGACALIWNQKPDLTHVQVKDRILSTVDPISALSGITVTGGRLNIDNAILKEDDSVPPSAITDLAATDKTLQSITLTWTATGDDGNTGTATLYDLRYSTEAITSDNFANVTQVAGEPAPSPSGSMESVTVIGLDYNTTYYFALKVKDNVNNWSGLSNIVNATTDVPTIIFQDDMEYGTSNWTGNWEQTTEKAYTISWTDSKNSYYSNNQDISLISTTIDLSKVSSASLEFLHQYSIEKDYDYGYVEVSIDNGSTWTQIKSFTDELKIFTKATVDLSAYAGSEIKIRFRLVTDSSVTYDGWYIDNVEVHGSDTASGWLTPNPKSGTVTFDQSTTITLTYDSTGMELGSYSTELNISTNDPNNNLIVVPAYLIVEVTPPSAPPVISITSPADGALLNTSQINVSGTIDYDYSTVTVNGIVAVVSNGTFGATITLSEGQNTITVIATNSAGTTTESITVTLDTTPPTISITQPADGTKTKDSSITVSGNVDDNIGVSQVTVNSQVATINGKNYTVSGIALDEGANTIMAQATDTAGNTNSTSITVTKDTTPPVITITEPADGSSTYYSTIPVSGTIDDSEATVTINGTPATVSNGTFNGTVNLSAGANTITVIATDTLGNASSKSITVTYLLGPEMEVSPETLPEVTLPLDQSTTQTLTISNVGDENLIFSIGVEETTTSSQGVAEQSSAFIDGEIPPAPEIPEHHPTRLLVKFKDGMAGAEAENVNALVGAETIKIYEEIGVQKIEILSNIELKEAIAIYMQSGMVEYAELDYVQKAIATPNDPSFSSLWGMHNTGQTGGVNDADIDAPEAWSITKGSSNVIVAVIDTGVDYNHVDLAANMWTDGNGHYGYDYYNNDNDPMDDNGHGTHCSGTVAAIGNNEVGVVGVNWTAKIMAMKFLSSGGGGWTSDAIDCVIYAVNHGARVLSNSWGGGGYSQALKDSIEYANSNNVLFIAAAGNSSNNNDNTPHYPSNYNCANIIAVAAVDKYDNLAYFSCYGPTTVDIGAPGLEILSTYPGNSYKSWAGTSMATPHVAGVAGLVLSQNLGLSDEQVKAKIMEGAVPIPALSGKCVSGGRLNAYNSLEQENDTTPPAAITNLSVSEIAFSCIYLTWTATGDDGNSGTASAYDIRYSTSEITADNFDQATQVCCEPAPKSTGSTETFPVTGLSETTLYYFAIKAIDNMENASNISNVPYAMTTKGETVFSDDMENGTANWSAQSPWGLVTNSYKSSSHSWHDSPGGNYGNYVNTSLTTKTLDLSNQNFATISFWHRYNLESNYDYGYFYVSTNNGSTWTLLKTYNGYQNSWVQETIEIPSYCETNVKFRFQLVTDYSVTYDGWYIDDVMISGSGLPKWLSLDTVTGNLAPQQSKTITLTYNSTNLSYKTYTANLNIYSNDINNSIVTRAISLMVTPPPQIEITSPENGFNTNISSVDVSGTIDDNNATVTVNDIPATVSNGTFEVLDISLTEGTNTITATATNQYGLSSSHSISVILDITPPSAPTIDPVTSPTNANTQTITGTITDVDDTEEIIVSCPTATVGELTYGGVPANGLQAYWKLDEESGTRTDSSGNNNHLLDANSVGYSTGHDGNAADFVPNGQHLYMPSGLYITGDKTVACWINLKSFNNSAANTIIARLPWGNGSLTDYIFYIEGGNNKLKLWNGSSGAESNAPIPVGSWHHLAFTRSGDYVTFYIDSESSGTFYTPGLAPVEDAGVFIGTHCPEAYADMKLDELCIWDRTLSSEEISDLYNDTGSSNTWSCTLTLAEGTNNISVTAKDKAGNTSCPATASITVDTIAPVINITSPSDADTVGKSTITVSGTIDDNNATVTVNGTSATVTSGSFSANIGLSEGSNTISAIATDNAGHTATHSITVTYDPSLKVITITSPEDGLLTNQNPIDVSGTIDDPNVTGVDVNGIISTISNGIFTSVDVPLQEGTNTVTATATISDPALNNIDTITVVLDTTAPSTPTIDAVTSPTSVNTQTISGTMCCGTFQISVTSSTATPGDVSYAVNTWSCTLTLAEGTNDISVTAKDEAGNISSPATANITLDTTAPKAPIGLEAAPGDNTVTLTWTANNESDLAGYNVYRKLSSSTSSTRIKGSVKSDITAKAGESLNLVKITLTEESNIDSLLTLGIAIYENLGSYAVGEVTDTELNKLSENGFSYKILDTDSQGKQYYMVWAPTQEKLETISQHATVLDIEPNSAIIHTDKDTVKEIPRHGFQIRLVRRSPLVLGEKTVVSYSISSEGTPKQDLIQEMVSQVQESSVRNYIQALQDFGNRYIWNNEYDQSSEYAFGEFQQMGLDVEYHSFSLYEDSTVIKNNVIATVTGKTKPDEIFIICGHLDTVSNCPGAEDNGSGSAVVMEAARVLSQYQFDSTIKFILFGAEEEWFEGSETYVNEMADSGANIVGALNFDMIAYLDTPDKDLTITSHSSWQELAQATVQAANTYTEIQAYNYISDSAWWSDHWSFWQRNYPAICGIEYDADHFYPWYHQPTDTIDKISTSFAAEVTKLGIATLAELANPFFEPVYEKINDTLVTNANYTDTTAVNNITYLYKVTALDNIGNESLESNEVSVTPKDTTAPVVSISSPADNSTVNTSTITVSGSVDDSEASVSVNGKSAVVSGNTFTVSGVSLNEGSNTITATATDNAGNSGTTSITVILDTTAPAISITSPSDADTIGKPAITVSGTIDDNNAAVAVNGVSASVANGSFSADGVGLEEGSNTITATATDTAGNAATHSISITYDPSLKVITISSPEDGSLTNQNIIDVSGTIDDPNVTGVDVNGVISTISNGIFTSVDVPLQEGTNTVTATATISDSGANNTHSISVILDITPPNAPAIDPVTSPTTTSTQTITGTKATDATQIIVSCPTATVGEVTSGGVPANGLQAYWKMDEESGTRSDSSGNNNHLLDANSVGYSTGHDGNAADFVPNGQHLYMPSGGLYITGDMTVACWINLKSFNNSSANTIIARLPWGNGSLTDYIFYIEGGNNKLKLWNGSSGAESNASIPVGSWHHIAFARSGDYITFYIDGESSGTFYTPGLAPVEDAGVFIGTHCPEAYADMKLDELCIWDRTLSSEEISDLYNDTGSSNTWSCTLTLAEGTNNISVTAKDKVGNISDAATASIVLDTTAPVVAITSPADGSTVSMGTSVTVSGTVNDNNATVTVNNKSATVSSDGTFSVSGITIVEGPNTITATAKDTMGNTASASITVTGKDDTPPEAPTIDAVISPTYINSQTISGTKSADTEQIVVTCSTAVVGTVTYANENTWSCTLINLGEGTNTITVVAKDKGGNESEFVTTSIILDTTIPSVAITSPADGYKTSTGSITVSGNVSDDKGISQVTVNTQTATIDGNTFTISGFALDEGVNTIQAQATDTAGNINSSSITVIKDTTPPAITITQPSDGTITYYSTIDTTGSVDDTEATVTINGEAITLTNGVFSKTINLSLGLNTITVAASDVLGNASSKSITVTYELGPNIDVSPATIPDVALGEGQTTTQTLTITNTGDSTLIYSVDTSETTANSSGIAEQSSTFAELPEHHPTRLLVKFKNGISGAEALDINTLVGAETIKTYGEIGVQKVEIVANIDLEEAKELYIKSGLVEYAEPDFVAKAIATPNDPDFSSLWGMHNTGQTGGANDADIDAPEAWDLTKGSSSVIIAVIDTGVDYNHQDLSANMWPGLGYDFHNNDSDPMDDNGHGTHCSGTIAGAGNNGVGVVGVNWTAQIMAVKFLSSSGWGYYSDAVDSIIYSVNNGARVTSNSWGGSAYSQALKDACEYANLHNVLVIAAAGNSSSNNDNTPHYPSNYDCANIIAVAAVDKYDNLAYFSCYGPTTVDIGAPGLEILSTFPGNSYKSWGGTSMATPHVAGVAGLVLSQNLNLSDEEVKAQIMNGAVPISALSGLCVTGGRLNAFNSLIQEDDDTPPAAITNLSVSATSFQSVTLTWTASGDDENTGTASSYDIRYSTSQITSDNFSQATEVCCEPTPKPAGNAESFTVSGLSETTVYYFAIKAIDNKNNIGSISNIPAAMTTKDTGNGPSWLSLDTKIGTLAPQQSKTITITYNSTNLPYETYTADINIYSNDTTNNTIIKSVSLMVAPPPQISITSPADETYTTISTVDVSGTIDDSDSTVTVNDIPATVSNGTFEVLDISLTEGTNTITAAATNQYDLSSSYSVSVVLDTIPPSTPAIDPVTSPTNTNSQTITGTKTTDAVLVIVSCDTATGGEVTYGGVPTDGLQAYWKMDEESGTRSDSSGNNNHLLDANSVGYSTGHDGNAADFVPNGQHLYMPSGGLYITGDKTVACWINLKSFNNSSANTIIARLPWGNGSLTDYIFYIEGGNNKLKLWNGSSGAESNASIPVGSWHHIAFARSGDYITFYIDGESSGTFYVPAVAPVEDAGVFIGKHCPEAYADMKLDELCIWDRTLSSEEISDLYNDSGSSNTWTCELTNLSEGDNNISVTAKDKAGNTSDAATAIIEYINPGSSSDSDGEGIYDAFDVFPDDPSEWEDTDSDGIGNNADPDDDNDGVLDENDDFPYDPAKSQAKHTFIVSASMPTTWDTENAQKSYENNLDVLDIVNPCWYELEADGTFSCDETDENVINNILTKASDNNILVIPYLNNYDDDTASFDPVRVSTVINDANLTITHVQNIVNEVTSQGYDGINIDYESCYADDRDAFTGFIKNLAAALHAEGKMLEVSVHAKTYEPGDWNGNQSQDWEALGQVADYFRIMTYDYHCSVCPPGPIAPVDWLDTVTTFALTLVDSKKLVMGVPFYGYDWVGNNGANKTYLEVQDIISTYNITPNWDSSAQEPYFEYYDDNDHTVYYQTSESVSYKLDLFSYYNVKGISVYRIGSEDPSNWGIIRTLLGIAPTDLKITCLGDSITHGYPYLTEPEKTYPYKLEDLLEQAYGDGSCNVNNYGVSGITADQLLAFLQLYDWLSLENPDIVLLKVGGNDLSEGDPSDIPGFIDIVNQTVAEVQAIIDLVTSHTNPDGSHPQIIVSTFIPVSDSISTEGIQIYNDKLKSTLTGIDLLIETNYEDFYDPSTGQAYSSLMSDELHPNEDGYALMAENWFDAVKAKKN